MKFAARSLLLFAALGATLAHAQTNNIPQVQHVIVVVQENRTPDNLFGSDAFATTHQLPGADLVQTGQCYTIPPPHTIQLQSITLKNSCDPDHSHGSWTNTYHGGYMDGACTVNTTTCTGYSTPPYTYVQSPDVVPYFQIATQYGYANYFFQTNQGPSFPAHQFLISGTSAPTNPGDPTVCYYMSEGYPCYQWFAAENTNDYNNENDYGCTAQDTVILDLDQNRNESPAYNNGHPCYNHNTLESLFDSQISPISWKYYSQAGQTPATALWTAPNAISGICGLNQTGTACRGSDWQNNVESVFPNQGNYPNSYSPILTDLGADAHQQQCTLPAVSWVIPNGGWSDHAGLDPHGAGPSWVAAIVNAVGGYDNSGNPLTTNCGYWANTVILITWDDWGGFYDHVLPWNCTAGPNGTCSGYNNGSGGVGGEYVYGFRVPLLVVSAYAKQGYISGKLPSPGEVQPYVHDFGSILNFIEYAFGQSGQPLHFAGFPPASGISPSYPYADVFAPDAPNTPGCNPTLCPYSLHDFFDFTNQRTFTPITTSTPGLVKTECFLIPKMQGCFGSNFTPSNPDAD